MRLGFEIIDQESFVAHLETNLVPNQMRMKLGDFIEAHHKTKYLLGGQAFRSTLGGNLNTIYKDDYYVFDALLNLIQDNNHYYLYGSRSDILNIRWKTLDCLLRKGIVIPLENSPVVLAKVNLLFS